MRLERLVNSLLEISRITGGSLALECEEVDLVLLVRDVAERFREQAEQLNTKVMLYTPPTVMGCWDRLRLEQIVGDLLSNAIKFGAGNPIEVRLDQDESCAHLQVVDHGIGIASEDQARIFERFERAVPTRHFGGFGLGLWIVRQIVEAMGGTIRVDSVVGQGAAFKVELPLEPPVRTDTEPVSETH